MIQYVVLDGLLMMHGRALARTGGTEGIRDPGALESAVAQPRQSFGGEELYPSLEEKAVALGFAIVRNHPFVDGNKRVAHAAMEQFLGANGHRIDAPIDEQERTMVAAACGSLGREELTAWVRANMRKRDAASTKSKEGSDA